MREQIQRKNASRSVSSKTKNANRIIKSDPPPPLGTVMKTDSTQNAQIKQGLDSGFYSAGGGLFSAWNNTTNTTETESTEKDTSDLLFAFWDDIKVLKTAGGDQKTETKDEKTTNVTLATSQEDGYTLDKTETKDDIEYVLLKQDDKEIGWVEKDALYTNDENNRIVFMDEYEEWLDDRYTEMEALSEQAQLDRIKGILSQAEKVISDYDDGTETDFDTLSKTPTYNNDNEGVTTPHELIESLRKWADLTEQTITGVTKETGDNVNAGSLYSDIDWHTRMKIPQYRTQSDNLTPPEVTCSPTTFAMICERAGWTREDLITAIDKKLTDDVQADLTAEEKKKGLTTEEKKTKLEEKWATKGKAFFTKINKAEKNYRKVRNTHIASSEFKDVAKKFKEIGQYEDLVYFYHYLVNNASATTMHTVESYNNKLRKGIENDGDISATSSFTYEKIDFTSKFDVNSRREMKEYLDNGYSMMLSMYHKGQLSGTHIVGVQTIDDSGIVVDDPFGKENPAYRNTGVKKTTDIFKDGKKSRGTSGFRNVRTFKASEKDYTKRDFTMAKAQNLKDNESRGRSTKLTWEMLNNSKKRIINYIVVWKE